ncbi:MAG: hypothetical protein Q8R36_03685 [bacterium]|nr:hypothetical protein [bacterium]
METLNAQKIIMPRVTVKFDRNALRHSIQSASETDCSQLEVFLAYLDKEKHAGKEIEFVGSIVAFNYEDLLMRCFKFEHPLEGCPSQISIKFVNKIKVVF